MFTNVTKFKVQENSNLFVLNKTEITVLFLDHHLVHNSNTNYPCNLFSITKSGSSFVSL